MNSPRINAERWLPWLLGLLLLGGGAWLWQATEWAELTIEGPPRGAAAHNRWYSLGRLAQGLGVQMRQRDEFSTLPSAGATLLIASQHWQLFPGRTAALQRWVEGGGHLVLAWSLLPARPDEGTEDDEDTPAHHADAAALRWIPAFGEFSVEDTKASQAQRKGRPRGETTALCRPYLEAAALPGAYGAPRRYAVCDQAGRYFELTATPRWLVQGPAGAYAATLPVGRGSVTVLGGDEILGNRSLLDGDHALLAAAALQLRAGRTLWLITDEKREPLLAWLWRHTRVALPLALLALALGLWRAGLRFGPLVAARPATRRAVTEQVRGTAAFLARQRSAALRGAQQRAVHEVAAARLPGYAALDADGRARLIARHTGLDEAALVSAFGAGVGPRAPAAELQLLETARRRLLKGAASPASHPETRHADRR